MLELSSANSQLFNIATSIFMCVAFVWSTRMWLSANRGLLAAIETEQMSNQRWEVMSQQLRVQLEVSERDKAKLADALMSSESENREYRRHFKHGEHKEKESVTRNKLHVLMGIDPD